MQKKPTRWIGPGQPPVLDADAIARNVKIREEAERGLTPQPTDPSAEKN